LLAASWQLAANTPSTAQEAIAAPAQGQALTAPTQQQLLSAVAALLPHLAVGGGANGGLQLPLPLTPPAVAQPAAAAWPAAADTSHSLQLPTSPVAAASDAPVGGSSEAPAQQPEGAALLPLLAAAAAAGDACPPDDQAMPSAAAAAAAGEGQLAFTPQATPSIAAGLAARLPPGRTVRGARTPASTKASGEQSGSWQTWVS
jgi:hypothetical protein